MTELVAAIKQEPADDGIDWDDDHAGKQLKTRIYFKYRSPDTTKLSIK